MADPTSRLLAGIAQFEECLAYLKCMLPVREPESETIIRLKKENRRLLALLRAHPPPRPQMLPQRRLRLAAAQKWRCGVCQEMLSEAFHADHLTPWSETFDDSDANICISCIPCHLSKTSEDNSARNRRRAAEP